MAVAAAHSFATKTCNQTYKSYIKLFSIHTTEEDDIKWYKMKFSVWNRRQVRQEAAEIDEGKSRCALWNYVVTMATVATAAAMESLADRSVRWNFTQLSIEIWRRNFYLMDFVALHFAGVFRFPLQLLLLLLHCYSIDLLNSFPPPFCLGSSLFYFILFSVCVRFACSNLYDLYMTFSNKNCV